MLGVMSVSAAVSGVKKW